MRVSIIISVRDDDRIVQCLRSIFTSGAVGFKDSFEVIVVENSDRPSLANDIKKFPVVYLVEPRRGMGFARDKAITVAKGEFIVFTDADCVVGESWLIKLLKPFGCEQVGIVGGPIAKIDPTNFTQKAQRDLIIGGQHEVQFLLPIYSRPYVATANAAYRSKDVKRAGGIDASFFSGGDVDLAWRVGDLGLRAVIAQDALVFHACRPTARAVFSQFYRYSVGHAYLFKKFKARSGKRICLNWYPFIGCFKAVGNLWKALFHPRPQLGRKIAIGSVGFEMIEYLALILGAFVGAIKTRTLYI